MGQHWTTSVFDESFAKGLSAEKAGSNFEGSSQLGEGFYTTRNEKALEYFGENVVSKYGGTIRKYDVYVQNFEAMKGSTVPKSLHWEDMLWKDNPFGRGVYAAVYRLLEAIVHKRPDPALRDERTPYQSA